MYENETKRKEEPMQTNTVQHQIHKVIKERKQLFYTKERNYVGE
jgi:hypothetical protein